MVLTIQRVGLPATAAAVAAACLSAGCAESERLDMLPEAPDPEEIEPFDPDEMQLFFTLNLEQAESLLENHSDTTIIDVRSAHMFARGHIPGALNYDAEFDGFADEIATLDREARILVYGDAEKVRADLAIGHMKALGFRQVNRLSVGFEAWVEAGLPYVRDLP